MTPISMSILLNEIVTIVSGGMPVLEKVQAAPEHWLRANISRVKYPACYVWSLGETLEDGPIGNDTSASIRYRVQYTLLQAGTDRESMVVGGGSKDSILDLSQDLLELIINNKQLNGKVTELNLPIQISDISGINMDQRRGLSLESIGRRFAVTYRAFPITWGGARP